jgi:hypothetical protein
LNRGAVVSPLLIQLLQSESQVYSYCGYFSNGDQLDPFAIILNQAENNRDRILGLLKKQHAVSALKP